jgi:uncharacterized protein (DUF885 family)
LSAIVDLADAYWAYYLGSAQLWNIDRGDVDQIEYWEDLSPEGVATRIEQLEGFVSRAEGFSASELSQRDHALLAAIAFSAGATGSSLPYDRDLALVAGPFNLATFLSVLVPGYALVTREHGEGYVAKLRALPAFIDGWIAGLREGLAVHRIATARGIADAIGAFDALLSTDPADDPLASQSPPQRASPREVDQWRAEVFDAIREAARPGIARLRAVLRDELLPAARTDEEAGICHLPGGDEAYQALLWAATSTDLASDAVHDLGVEHLALLDDAYRDLGPITVGVQVPSLLRDRLRIDASLQYATADEIIADVTAALGRAESEAPRWFARLPRARCDIVMVGAGPTAYYTAPSPDGNRSGTFFINTANPTAWTRYQLEVSTFHEAVPGHHLQLALAQELALHPVLGELEVTSYSEGWGLYAEQLADEMSLYSSALQRVGMLALDSLRAARLVVDTGLHAKGWTRDRAIDFLLAHTVLDRRGAEAEIDRYIATPGQATSYMIGRLEIERLRQDARRHLGPRFSICDFHHVVLANGMTPLDELARTIDGWLHESSGPSAPPSHNPP